MKLIVIQIVFLVGIFLLNMLCLLLPQWIFLRSHNRELSYKSQRIMSFCDCVSGGVFLGVCFIGLLPMVRDMFDMVFGRIGVDVDYPVSELIIVLGFFLMLLMEQCIHKWQDRQKGKSSHSHHEMLENDSLYSGDTSTEESDTTEEEVNKEETVLSITQGPISNGAPKKRRGRKRQGHSHAGHGHSHLDAFQATTGLRCAILMLALSVHSLFEGMAVGLQTDYAKLVNLYIGVLVHECLVALAIGTSLAKTGMQMCTVVKLGVVFSLMIPVGMAVGLAMGQIDTVGGVMTSAIIQALAAGTFVYVIFLEILPGEINNHADSMYKLIFLFLGFILIAALTAINRK